MCQLDTYFEVNQKKASNDKVNHFTMYLSKQQIRENENIFTCIKILDLLQAWHTPIQYEKTLLEVYDYGVIM